MTTITFDGRVLSDSGVVYFAMHFSIPETEEITCAAGSNFTVWIWLLSYCHSRFRVYKRSLPLSTDVAIIGILSLVWGFSCPSLRVAKRLAEGFT